MEEKIFDFLSKMYTEMQDGFKDIRQDMSGLKQDVNTLKEDVSGLKQDVNTLKEDVSSLKQDIIRIEHKMDDKLGALFDVYTHHEERMGHVEKKLDILIDNYERQDVKIEVIHSRAK